MRWLMSMVAAMAIVAGFVTAPPAVAEGTPIGNLGDTLRVQFKGIVADVTVHDVVPTDPPPGYTPNGSPRWRQRGRSVEGQHHGARRAGAQPVHHVRRVRLRWRDARTRTRTPRRTPMLRTRCSTSC